MVCSHYDVIYRTCEFLYKNNTLINKKDLIPKCDGKKNFSLCCWYSNQTKRFISDDEIKAQRNKITHDGEKNESLLPLFKKM